MSDHAERFDHWVRGRFADLNSELEALYFAGADRSAVEDVGGELKAALLTEGQQHVHALRIEGNTDEGFDHAFDVLGNLGMWFAAMRRHELTNPAREAKSPFEEASALGMHVGASTGMAPRFSTSHLSTHNRAIDGRPKTFTRLADEQLFLDCNTRAIFAYQRTADALTRIAGLDISHPVALTLFSDARRGLDDVAHWNDVLMRDLDVDRFFYSVRPYYKPYRVGRQEYRGANAGDFAGINEIDLLTGVARANDPYYAQILVDKMPFMRPQDQASLRDCMRRRDFLSQFLEALPAAADKAWFVDNGRAFIAVCDAHGRAAAQHHDELVSRFIERPSIALSGDQLSQLTASGPPLPVLIASLAVLRDLRTAAPRTDIPSRHAELAKLRQAVGSDHDR